LVMLLGELIHLSIRLMFIFLPLLDRRG